MWQKLKTLCMVETVQTNCTGLKHTRVRIVVSDFSNKTFWPWQITGRDGYTGWFC